MALAKLVKDVTTSVRVIGGQMMNPFWWRSEGKKNLLELEKKVPGAIERVNKGEIIPEWEYITEGKLGWEYRQVLAGNQDPWCLETAKYPRSNHAKPHIIYTMESYRIIGCVDCMDDLHYINYILVKSGEMGRCRDCGSCYLCMPHPEPELIWQDHH
eukprot:sb/3473101/